MNNEKQDPTITGLGGLCVVLFFLLLGFIFLSNTQHNQIMKLKADVYENGGAVWDVNSDGSTTFRIIPCDCRKVKNGQ